MAWRNVFGRRAIDEIPATPDPAFGIFAEPGAHPRQLPSRAETATSVGQKASNRREHPEWRFDTLTVYLNVNAALDRISRRSNSEMRASFGKHRRPHQRYGWTLGLVFARGVG